VRTLALLLLGLAAVPAARGSEGGPDGYRLGPGDVLELVVEGRPELARLPTVQTTGVIHVPMLGEVPVAERTPHEVAARLTYLLGREGVAGPVTVRVRAFNNRSVWVSGAVNRPGRKGLRGADRLIDLLLEAGGFTAEASGEVEVLRRDGVFDDGSTSRRFRFQAGVPSESDRAHLVMRLWPGDVVTASVRQFVTVKGQVGRPGRYVLREGMTVSQALKDAGGLTRFGHPKVVLQRALPRDGEASVSEVDLRAVEKGGADDVLLRAEDALSVRARKL
jgi:polysaccharide export outer membrane protein